MFETKPYGEKLRKGLNDFYQEFPGAEIIFLSESGSLLHGTANKESDVDIKGVFIPSYTDLMLKKKTTFRYTTGDKRFSNDSEDFDLDLYDIRDFFDNLGKNDITAVDLFFSLFSKEAVLYKTEKSEFIKTIKAELLTKRSKSFLGFALKQVTVYTKKAERLEELRKLKSFFEKYEFGTNLEMRNALEYFFKEQNYKFLKKVVFQKKGKEEVFFEILGRRFSQSLKPARFYKELVRIEREFGDRVLDAAKNNNLSLKAVAHAFRAVLELLEYYNTGSIKFPLSTEIKNKVIEIKEVKEDKDLDSLLEELDKLLEKVYAVEEKSELPVYQNKVLIKKRLIEIIRMENVRYV